MLPDMPKVQGSVSSPGGRGGRPGEGTWDDSITVHTLLIGGAVEDGSRGPEPAREPAREPLFHHDVTLAAAGACALSLQNWHRAFM